MTDPLPAAVWTALARRLMTSSGARSNAAQGLRDVRRQRADAAEGLGATSATSLGSPAGAAGAIAHRAGR